LARWWAVVQRGCHLHTGGQQAAGRAGGAGRSTHEEEAHAAEELEEEARTRKDRKREKGSHDRGFFLLSLMNRILLFATIHLDAIILYFKVFVLIYFGEDWK
jgi:hypothetical protein